MSDARSGPRPPVPEPGSPPAVSGGAPARERWRPPSLAAPAGAPASAAVEDTRDPGAPAPPREAHEEGAEDTRQGICEEALKEVREEAYRAAFAQGFEEGRAEAQALARRMRELLQALEAPFAQTDAGLMRELLGLTERVCRALLERELRTDREAIARVLSAALDALGESHTAVELTLNPADALLCRELGVVTEGTGEFTLRENAEVRRGGVLLRRGSERIDARIETRLRTLIEGLYAQAGLPEAAPRPDDPRPA